VLYEVSIQREGKRDLAKKRKGANAGIF